MPHQSDAAGRFYANQELPGPHGLALSVGQHTGVDSAFDFQIQVLHGPGAVRSLTYRLRDCRAVFKREVFWATGRSSDMPIPRGPLHELLHTSDKEVRQCRAFSFHIDKAPRLEHEVSFRPLVDSLSDLDLVRDTM